MRIMARPVEKKTFLGPNSFVVNTVNGCEVGVNPHEVAGQNAGGSPAMVFDAIRLAAVAQGVCVATHAVPS